MPVNPVVLEIIRGRLYSTINEMELLMERCAMSPFIKEKKDYFVGIFDTQGRLVCCHISQSGPGMITPILEVYALEEMRAGDVYWYNDPHLSKGAVQHHQDMVFAVPVFHDGRAVAFTVTYGHYQDIGDLLRLMTCGGGGWGDPYTRDPLVVRQDVVRGLVTVLGALADYGVVLDPLTLELDKVGTEERRRDHPTTSAPFNRGPTFAAAEAEWSAKHFCSISLHHPQPLSRTEHFTPFNAPNLERFPVAVTRRTS